MKALLLLPLAVALTGCLSVSTPRLPEPAPARQSYQPGKLFSPVVRADNLLFLSGVIGRDEQGGANGIEAETRRALDKIRDRLALAGGRMEDIVKCQVLLADIADYDKMNGVYEGYFPKDPPARTAVAVKALPANAVVEIDCIAVAR